MKTFKSYGFLFFIFFTCNIVGQENFKNEGERIKYANKLFECKYTGTIYKLKSGREKYVDHV